MKNSIEFTLSKKDFPSNQIEIKTFLASSHIKELSKSFLEQGHSSLIDFISYAKTGAKALCVSAVAAHNLGHSKVFFELRCDYNVLLEQTAMTFIDMQSTNIGILGKLINAKNYFELGNVDKGIESLNSVKDIAQTIEKNCSSLIENAQIMTDKVREEGNNFAGFKDEIEKSLTQKT